MIEPTDLLEQALNYSEYVKGAEYSASDITSEPLMVRLRKKYPKLDDIKTEDKVKAFIGTGTHLLLENFIHSIKETNIQSEVKVKYKNLSGTIDVLLPDGTICDWKTGSEKTLSKKIKEPIDWIKQLSVYSFLNYKQNNVPMQKYGYIFWIATEGKYGTLKIELLSREETITLIKDFMAAMKQPIEELEECEGCKYWRHRWCSARSKCHIWEENKTSDFSTIETW